MTDPQSTFLGLRTVVYYVKNLETAKHWYTSVLGLDPHFDTPHYVGFHVGGFELGLHPTQAEPGEPAKNSSVTYWGVPNIENELKRLVYLGASPRTDIQEFGDGIKLADVVDPFGNVIGLIENRHFPDDPSPYVDADEGFESGDD